VEAESGWVSVSHQQKVETSMKEVVMENVVQVV